MKDALPGRPASACSRYPRQDRPGPSTAAPDRGLGRPVERRGRAGRFVGGGRSVLKGRKVPPKYRGPSGETWAGRGARPRWLVAAIKGGKKLDDFLIDKSARKGRRKR